MSYESTAQMARRVGYACFALGTILMLLYLRGANRVEPPFDSTPYVLGGFLALIVCFALGVGLITMAAILERRPGAIVQQSHHTPEPVTLSAQMRDQIDQIHSSLSQVQSTLTQVINTEPVNERSSITTVNTTGGTVDHALLERIEKALDEIREFTLMTDVERQQRLGSVVEERKRQIKREVMEHIAKQEFGQAEHLLATLEAHFPDDPATSEVRRNFEFARQESEEDAVFEADRRVESLISIESYDQAHQVAMKLVENFPANASAKTLLSRVTRARETWVETQAQHLFEEVREATEVRSWRKALSAAHKLIYRFPQYSRAGQIREQIPTIRDNAEIEERQEIEVQIEEMIRARQYAEAIQLGDDLIRRYPYSPQAETLQRVIPRLREVLEEEAQTS